MRATRSRWRGGRFTSRSPTAPPRSTACCGSSTNPGTIIFIRRHSSARSRCHRRSERPCWRRLYDSTAPLTIVALDAPDLANEAINGQRWPIEIKMHGDFRSRRLKNTSDELRQQDARLRKLLVDSCRRWGLVVAGYSGRDNSIMDALTEGVRESNPFPAGLFWLHRGDDPPLSRVQALLQLAAERGVNGALVRIENFDEAMRDLVRLLPALDTSVLDSFGLQRRRWSAAVIAG